MLDDSQTLCLANGERIKLKPEMKVLFEVLDLAVASPATVSRCGMVYIDAQIVGYHPIVESYFKNNLISYFKDQDMFKDFMNRFFLLFGKCTNKIKKGKLKQTIPVEEPSLAISCCRLIKVIFELDPGISYL